MGRWTIVVDFEADMELMRRVAPPYATLTPSRNGVRFQCPTDDLDAAARYLMLMKIPFTVKGPFELRQALQGLAEETARMAARAVVR